jgi:hypothetical protein
MESLRFLNKEINHQERENFSNWWLEQINILGQDVIYYSNLSSLSGYSVLYGEHPGAGYSNGVGMTLLLNISNDSYLLSKFGMVADSDMNCVIHPKQFTNAFGLSAEPKMGDLIKLSEFGSDRLNFPKRGPTVYEVSEVVDEFQINALGGHYVYFLKCKRYDYSNEPNSPGAGQGNTPINDNDKLDVIADLNFNYPVDNPCSNTNVYGEY